MVWQRFGAQLCRSEPAWSLIRSHPARVRSAQLVLASASCRHKFSTRCVQQETHFVDSQTGLLFGVVGLGAAGVGIKWATSPMARCEEAETEEDEEEEEEEEDEIVEPLEDEEYDRAAKMFMELCADCHGVDRRGYIGPSLEAHVVQGKGPEHVRAFITYGSEGMISFGENHRDGGDPHATVVSLPSNSIEMMVRYLHMEPKLETEIGLKQMIEWWNVIVPVDERPTSKMNNYNTDNFFAVCCDRSGDIVFVDGDSHEFVNAVNISPGIHVVKPSHNRRYLYTISRDATVGMIDMWYETPKLVATSRCGHSARSIEPSKCPGWEDQFVLCGVFYPPQFVLLAGDTLEPLKIHSTRGMMVVGEPVDASQPADEEEYHATAGCGAIFASHYAPEFFVTVRQTGMVLQVDYSDLKHFKVTHIPIERGILDGGPDYTHRYLLLACTSRNAIGVLDTAAGSLVTMVREGVGSVPHAGKGNWIFDEEFGPLWFTGHMADSSVIGIGMDPVHHPEHAWKVVKTLESTGSGNFFAKTHPNSNNYWMDHILNNDPDIAGSVSVFDKTNLDAPVETIPVARLAGILDGFPRTVHPEYNKAGDEMWIGIHNDSQFTSAIVVMDDKTRKIKKVITHEKIEEIYGKFNIFNAEREMIG